MKIPRGNGFKDRIAICIHRLYQYWWCRIIIGPLILAVPGLVTGFYGFSDFHKAVMTWLPSLGKVLDEHVLIIVILALIFPMFLLSSARWVLQRVHSRTITVDWLNPLNAALDRVVGCKANRFSAAAQKTNMAIKREDAFCQITQPQMQIAELVRGICEFFNAVRLQSGNANDNTRLIRVNLAEIRNNEVVRLPIFYPEDEPVPVQAIPGLNAVNSAIKVALMSKNMLVIHSIKKEMEKPVESRRFVDIGYDGDNIGSIICYPIIYPPTGDIPFVISIHCDEEDYFKESRSDLYRFSLERFALRLNLEYSLLLMKETLCD